MFKIETLEISGFRSALEALRLPYDLETRSELSAHCALIPAEDLPDKLDSTIYDSSFISTSVISSLVNVLVIPVATSLSTYTLISFLADGSASVGIVIKSSITKNLSVALNTISTASSSPSESVSMLSDEIFVITGLVKSMWPMINSC